MRPLTLLLLLGLAACSEPVEPPAEAPLLTVDVTLLHSVIPEGPLADHRITVESLDGTYIRYATTDDAGRASLEVDWTEGPFAVTVPGELPYTSSLTLLGVDEDHAAQRAQLWRQDIEPVDTVVVTGTVTPRTKGSTLLVMSQAWPGAYYQNATDRYYLEVATGEPIELVALEFTYDRDDRDITQNLFSWTVFEHPATDANLTLDLDLTPGPACPVGSTPLTADRATFEVTVPYSPGSTDTVVHAMVSRGEAGAYQPVGFLSEHAPTALNAVGLTVDWVALDAASEMSTLLQGSSAWGTLECNRMGSPDLVPADVEMLPFPVLQDGALAESNVAVVQNLPDGTFATLTVGSGAASTQLIDVTGSSILELPQRLLDAYAGGTPLVTAGITDTLHVEHVQMDDYCVAAAPGVRVQL